MKKTHYWGVSPIPSGAFSRILEDFDSIFESWFVNPSYPSFFKTSGYPVNTRVTKDKDGNVTHSVIEVALAGVPREAIKVTVDEKGENKYLNISVDKQSVDDNVIYKSTTSKAFQTSYFLTNKLDTENIDVKLKDGLLTVSVPLADKPPENKSKELKIN